MKPEIKKDKGVAGLTILLSVIVLLFVIGLLVMVFALMGGKLRDSDSLYTTSVTYTINNETTSGFVNATGTSLSVGGYRDVVCAVVNVTNATGDHFIPSTNYTVTNCLIQADETGANNGVNNTYWNVTYTYYYSAPTQAVSVINDTNVGISESVDWFALFIVITAMVVLVLLTVIIITAIRGSGLIAGGQGNQGAGKIGSA